MRSKQSRLMGDDLVRANRICHPLHLNRTHLLPSSPLATLDALRICQKRIVIFCLCFIILLRTVDCRRHTVTPPHGHNLRAGVSTDGSVAPMHAPPRGRGSPPPPTPRPSPHHSILPRRCLVDGRGALLAAPLRGGRHPAADEGPPRRLPPHRCAAGRPLLLWPPGSDWGVRPQRGTLCKTAHPRNGPQGAGSSQKRHVDAREFCESASSDIGRVSRV